MVDSRPSHLKAIDHQRQAMDQLLGRHEPWAQEAFFQIAESVREMLTQAHREQAATETQYPSL